VQARFIWFFVPKAPANGYVEACWRGNLHADSSGSERYNNGHLICGSSSQNKTSEVWKATRRCFHQIFQGAIMNAARVMAIALIVAGVLALAYGGFSYTKETQEVKLGSFELSVKNKETVNIPVWAGVGAIAAGVLILIMRK
jgi:hypothetical protein